MHHIARSVAISFAAMRRAVALVMVLPFVLLSLMAQGTMVAQGVTPESFMVVLCADHLPVEMVLDGEGNVVRADEYRAEHSQPVPKTPKPPCDWSVHAQPMLGAAPMLPIVAAMMGQPADLAPAHDLRVLRAEVLAPSARGPPAA
ncbi:hypothetical protein RGQ15_22220 [Paracoccus sp. MBLB3053]|uniref:DUF2946 domain-containing protein n=1 Tax=Paracoccus aurantius TaxID=3073814 RepID=A0ABU2I0E1_9RHOB|nr:hypothetical protein [Paracoccus sp. MBLB3053]MDS9470265.1 hypothetical protein [Paracoccus sp. MBLB3053]